LKIYRFDAGVSRKITHYNSDFLMSLLLQAQDVPSIHIGCMHLPPNGIVGYHQAKIPQLLLVVQGEGWVRGESSEQPIRITSGQAAFWEAGEFHETTSLHGMTAIVIESEALAPHVSLQEV
jgi:quercetin dioxygenase-like cupin family protein